MIRTRSSPSETSSSAMPEFSTSSINVFSLRKSMDTIPRIGVTPSERLCHVGPKLRPRVAAASASRAPTRHFLRFTPCVGTRGHCQRVKPRILQLLTGIVHR